MMQRLNSITYIMHQKQNHFILPVTEANEINALQNWLEQLSANIQTNGCLYPNIIPSSSQSQSSNSSSPTPTYPASSTFDTISHPFVDTLELENHPQDQALYPNHKPTSISSEKSPSSSTTATTYPWSYMMQAGQHLFSGLNACKDQLLYSSISTTTNDSNNNNNISDANESIQSSLSPTYPSSLTSSLSTSSLSPKSTSTSHMDASSLNHHHHSISPSFWKTDCKLNPSSKEIELPIFEGPSPSEEVDFSAKTTIINKNQQQQQETLSNHEFETSQIEATPMIVTQENNSNNGLYETKKEMMHMINVFTSPSQNNTNNNSDDDGKKEENKGVTIKKEEKESSNSDPIIIANEDQKDNESKKSLIITSHHHHHPVKENEENIKKKKIMISDEIIEHIYSETSNSSDDDDDDEDDDETTYADLTGMVKNISLKDEETENRLRERHAQLVDLLWKATIRTLSTSDSLKRKSKKSSTEQLYPSLTAISS